MEITKKDSQKGREEQT